MGEGGTPAAELHIGVEPDVPERRQGAGGVHHVAFACRPIDDYDAWAERLERDARFQQRQDRPLLVPQSLFPRAERRAVRDWRPIGPGFATDEPIDKLGETLSLPPFLEARRSEIEANLKPL